MSESSIPRPSHRRGVVATFTKFAPYAIAGLALFWVLRGLKLAELQRVFADTPLTLFVGTSAVMLLLNCAADTFAMQSVFRWFGVAVPFFDLYVVRGSTYLLRSEEHTSELQSQR